MENSGFSVDSSKSAIEVQQDGCADELSLVEALNDTSFCDISTLEDDKSEFSNSSDREIADFLMKEAGLYFR